MKKIIRIIRSTTMSKYFVTNERTGTFYDNDDPFSPSITISAGRGFKDGIDNGHFFYMSKNNKIKDLSSHVFKDITNYLLHFSDKSINEFKLAHIL